MDHELSTWFEQACLRSDTHASDCCADDIDAKVLGLGRKVFSLAASCTIHGVIQEIKRHYKVTLSSQATEAMVEFFLIHAMSPECKDRDSFVEDIISMSDETQSALMLIIRTKKEELAAEEEEEERANASSATYGSSRNNNSNGFCQGCYDKAQEVDRLKNEVDSALLSASAPFYSPCSSLYLYASI